MRRVRNGQRRPPETVTAAFVARTDRYHGWHRNRVLMDSATPPREIDLHGGLPSGSALERRCSEVGGFLATAVRR